jgi:peptidoglycan/xylan/chitin deacetylase (PgdA/CDA1 family)
VLAILAAHHAKGTFFINGKNVTSDAHRQLLAQMVADGHIIGNHSQHHLDLKTVDAATLASEVDATSQVLAATGEQPGYFRFPFGSAGCSQVAAVRAKGYAVVGWHIDSADWCYNSPTGGVGTCDPRTFKWVDDQYRNDIIGNVLSQARASDGGVLLFHDIHAYTVSRLDEILTALENDGFSIVLVSDPETFPLLNGAKPADQPWVGTPCSKDADCAFTVNGEKGTCYTFGSNGFCTYACNGTCQDRAGKSVTFCTSLDGQSGMCVAKSSALNQSCAGIPGTAEVSSDRFIGQSSSSAASAIVCLPQ